MKPGLVMAFAVALMLSACATSSMAPVSSDAAQTSAQAGAGNGREAGNVDMGTLSSGEIQARKLEESLQEWQKRSVYFDFDAFAIKPEYREVIRQQAEFLKANGNVMVTLEGNADERGSSEYNLALGSLRAKAVSKVLELMGVPAERIEVVSMGSEHPRQACHAESCWQENRRVDFQDKSGP